MIEKMSCNECIWHTKDGCWLWDCDCITRAEAKKLVDAARKEKDHEN